jgi:hypothetical protein
MLWKVWERMTPKLTFYERRRRLIVISLGMLFAIIIVASVAELMIKLSKPR